MSALAEWRETIGTPQQYKGHTITVHPMAPDVLSAVDGRLLPNYYVNAESARQGGMRYIDAVEKEKNK